MKKLKKLSKKTKKRILIAESAVLIIAIASVFAVYGAKTDEPDYPKDDALSSESLELKAKMDEAKAEKDEAKAAVDAAEADIRKLDTKLLFKGEKVRKIRLKEAELFDALAVEEQKYEESKTNTSSTVKKAKERYVNCGRYFLDSKASTSVEYWTKKAKSYGATSASANSSTFPVALRDALSYDHLMLASYQIDKSNSLGNINRQIDYNLMVAAAVSAAVYAGDHGLVHTFAHQVIGSNYGPWEDENLAYGMNAEQSFRLWYYSERANNGPHFRNIVNHGRTTTGYGYTVVGSMPPSHTQEFGVKGGNAVLTTTSKFRADLKAYRDKAKAEYEKELGKSITNKMKPANLLQLEADHNTAVAKLVKAGEKIGVDYQDLLDTLWAAKKVYEKKQEAYLAAKAAFEASLPQEEEIESDK